MIFILSPAKALDFETPLPACAHTQPDFLADAAELVAQLRDKTPAELAALMSISDRLAVRNAARFEQWQPPFTPANARQALLAFDGDVYDGLDARTLDADALDWAQAHVRILSGLYGVLRPLDLIQAYRLEMGTRLANARGKTLYAFWGKQLTRAVNEVLAAEGKNRVLVNLASQEYFKALATEDIAAPVITPVFEDWKDGRWRVLSFYAKRARGLMMRYAIECRAQTPADLVGFERAGYAFAAEASDEHRLVFRRRAA